MYPRRHAPSSGKRAQIRTTTVEVRRLHSQPRFVIPTLMLAIRSMSVIAIFQQLRIRLGESLVDRCAHRLAWLFRFADEMRVCPPTLRKLISIATTFHTITGREIINKP